MIYRIIRFFEELPRRVKWFFQKIFRQSHASDLDLWGLSSRLAEIILPKLRAFKKINVNSYPACFSDWNEDGDEYGHGGIGQTKEEYDKAIEDGTMVGGEMEEWHKVLDEMIYACEWHLADQGSRKLEKEFAKKYGDCHAEIPENLKQNDCYRKKGEDGGFTMFSDGEEPDLENYVLIKDHFLGKPFYYDMKMSREHGERAQKGFKLLGKHFLNLWD